VAIQLPTHLQAALADLGEGLGHLRLCNAEVQQAMERSLASHGQITPLVVCERPRGYEVIDGFKRLRAARTLKWDVLWVHVTDVRGAAAKVQIVHSNRRESLTEIEEAWIIRALHREDGLSQPEIGRLLGHHKSWVNRRLLLAEALSEELQVDLRLGLVGATTARELCRLPRGNQREVGAVCVRRGLTTRQTQLLVDSWLGAGSDDARAALLQTIRGTQTSGPPEAPRRPRSPAEWLMVDAEELRRRCGRMHGRLVAAPLPAGDDDGGELQARLRGLVPVLSGLLGMLSQTLPRRQVNHDPR
jgi:ParB/RepB/Spo0J family partition protein